MSQTLTIRPDLQLQHIPNPIFEGFHNDWGIFYLMMPQYTLSAQFKDIPHHWMSAMRFEHGTMPWPARAAVQFASDPIVIEVGMNPLNKIALLYDKLRVGIEKGLFDNQLHYIGFVATMPHQPFERSYLGRGWNTSPQGRFGKGMAGMSARDRRMQVRTMGGRTFRQGTNTWGKGYSGKWARERTEGPIGTPNK